MCNAHGGAHLTRGRFLCRWWNGVCLRREPVWQCTCNGGEILFLNGEADVESSPHSGVARARWLIQTYKDSAVTLSASFSRLACSSPLIDMAHLGDGSSMSRIGLTYMCGLAV